MVLVKKDGKAQTSFLLLACSRSRGRSGGEIRIGKVSRVGEEKLRFYLDDAGLVSLTPSRVVSYLPAMSACNI